MNIRSIELDKDYGMIKEWCEAHNMTPYIKETLSDTGFIIDDICAGWLYKTNSKICYIENFISNKEKTKQIRSEALDILFENLISTAQKEGFNYIITSSNIPSLISKGTEKFKFKMTEQFTMFIRSL